MAVMAPGFAPIGAAGFGYASVVRVDGRVTAMDCRLPLLVDVPACVARRLSRRYPPSGWSPQDVFITNDPYEGGVRLDVVSVLVPVFVGGAAAALAAVGARHSDIGAMSESAFAYRREIRHEGFRLSLLRVGGPPWPELFAAMLRANVRAPDDTMRALDEQLRVAKMIAAESGAVGPPDADAGAVDEFLRRNGRRFGRGAASLPDEYGAGMISTEVACDAGRIRVALAAEGISGAAPPAPLAATRAAALSALEDVSALPAWSFGGRLELELGEAPLLDAQYPAAVAACDVTAFAVYSAVLNALAAAGAAPRRIRSRSAFFFPPAVGPETLQNTTL